MRNRDEIINTLRESYDYLHSEFSVSKIAVFGSVAKDMMTDNSDVDILVEFENPIGFLFNQLVEYFEEILSCKVDVLTMEGIKNIRIKSVATDIEKSLIYV